jgi:DNA-binding beta-propeller fold protein YncE
MSSALRASVIHVAFVLMLTACSRESAVSDLKPREWRAWQLPPEGPSLPTPRSLAVGPNDELGVLDTAGRVTVYDAGGTLLRQWHMLDVSVGKPEGLTILKDGRVVVCDTHYHRIVYFDANGNWLRNFGSEGTGRSQFIFPVGICKDPAENLYICEYGGHDRVQKFTREGEWLGEFGSFGTGTGQFQRPSGLTWLDGKIYVTDAINHRVLIFTDAGKFLQNLGDPNPPHFQLPYDIALGPDGILNVIEYGAGRLSRLKPDGRLVGRLGETGQGTGQFATPWGLTVDSKGRIYVADTKNRRLVALRL